MRGHPSARIGEICQLVNGRAFKPSDWGTAGLPIVRIQNLNDSLKPFNCFAGPVKTQHLIDDGDVLLSWSGTPGTSFGCFVWQGGQAVLNQHIFKVEIQSENVDKNYFVWAVNSKLDEMIEQAHGAVGLRHITKDKLERIELPLPPIEEQHRIVAWIKESMERVREIELLVRGVTEDAGRLYSVIPNEIEGSGLWKTVAVGRVLLDSQNGRSLKPQSEGSNGFVLSLSAVRDIDLDITARKPVALSDAVASKYRLREGDTFISRANTSELVGLASIVDNDPPELTIFPDLMIRLRPDHSVVRSRYLVYALRTRGARTQLQERAIGSSQSMVKISGGRLREVQIPLPPLEAQDELISRLDQLLGAACQLRCETERHQVAAFRRAILRMGFTS